MDPYRVGYRKDKESLYHNWKAENEAVVNRASQVYNAITGQSHPKPTPPDAPVEEHPSNNREGHPSEYQEMREMRE